VLLLLLLLLLVLLQIMRFDVQPLPLGQTAQPFTLANQVLLNNAMIADYAATVAPIVPPLTPPRQVCGVGGEGGVMGEGGVRPYTLERGGPEQTVLVNKTATAAPIVTRVDTITPGV
jgi:hypothetical protein